MDVGVIKDNAFDWLKAAGGALTSRHVDDPRNILSRFAGGLLTNDPLKVTFCAGPIKEGGVTLDALDL